MIVCRCVGACMPPPTYTHTQTMCAHTDRACRVCALLSSQVRSCLLFAERFPPFASLADRFQRGALFVASHSNWLRNTLSTPKLLQLSALSQQARSMRVYEHVGRGGWMQMCGGCLCAPGRSMELEQLLGAFYQLPTQPSRTWVIMLSCRPCQHARGRVRAGNRGRLHQARAADAEHRRAQEARRVEGARADAEGRREEEGALSAAWRCRRCRFSFAAPNHGGGSTALPAHRAPRRAAARIGLLVPLSRPRHAMRSRGAQFVELLDALPMVPCSTASGGVYTAAAASLEWPLSANYTASPWELALLSSHQLLVPLSAKSGSDLDEGRSLWVPDKEAPDCHICRMPFTPINRRHHCRRCGSVVCAQHSLAKMIVPRVNAKQRVRVCDHCSEIG